jgi:chromosome segregation ATPase
MEHLKAAQISETRSQLHAELQSLKRQHLSNTELYELEIRKLKDLLERKDYELEEAKSRVSRAFNENEFEIVRLREEKDRLRGELAQYEAERKRDSDNVRNKLESYYLSEIEAMKKTHLANLEAIEFENIRLKDSLAGKNQEIESLLVKHQKLKQNADETHGLLRSENDILRQKLVELERIGEVEFESLKSKLQNVH